MLRSLVLGILDVCVDSCKSDVVPLRLAFVFDAVETAVLRLMECHFAYEMGLDPVGGFGCYVYGKRGQG